MKTFRVFKSDIVVVESLTRNSKQNLVVFPLST